MLQGRACRLNMAENNNHDKDLARRIGGQLKALRESRGITRLQAAAVLGVSVQTYGNRENGLTELPAHELVLLADLLKVDVGVLFHGLDGWAPPPGVDLALLELAKEAENFLHLMHRIPNERLRRDVAEAVKAIAKADLDDC